MYYNNNLFKNTNYLKSCTTTTTMRETCVLEHRWIGQWHIHGQTDDKLSRAKKKMTDQYKIHVGNVKRGRQSSLQAVIPVQRCSRSRFAFKFSCCSNFFFSSLFEFFSQSKLSGSKYWLYHVNIYNVRE